MHPQQGRPDTLSRVLEDSGSVPLLSLWQKSCGSEAHFIRHISRSEQPTTLDHLINQVDV